jgi:hypothetical protein
VTRFKKNPEPKTLNPEALYIIASHWPPHTAHMQVQTTTSTLLNLTHSTAFDSRNKKMLHSHTSLHTRPLTQP